MAETMNIRRWPRNANDEYITARSKLLEAERNLKNEIERVATLRRALPLGAAMSTYVFEEGPRELGTQAGQGNERVTKIALQDLVGERSLVVYHLMLGEDDDEACPMCSMWVDGFNGIVHHLNQRVDFAIIAQAPLPKLRDWARKRGWNKLRLLSSFGTTFNADMNLERPDWQPNLKQSPGVSVFRKDGDGIVHHIYTCTPEFVPKEQRGMDLLSPVWNVLDIVPEGRDEWFPNNSYA
jgi:predicted dithiol-disulfide oxidoreductase (DUF899 family)